ncbi:MAG: ABC transporter permease [Firmicutes bacterium]|jgi:peptide/nickel transport system permease protein|nr:ABC transporter permease [Bacillota bacterium]
MTKYIGQRLVQALLTLILITLIVFFMMRLLPGDPLLIYLGQRAELHDMTDEALEELRKEFGLDKPIMVQYVNWVAGALRLDLGTSIFYREDVGTLMKERFPITLYLGCIAMAVSTTAGILIGLLAAVRRGAWPDKIISPLTYIGVTIPAFWLGIILIYVFAQKLGWLPVSGFTSPFKDFVQSTRQIILPVICLSAFGVASTARQMRSSMLEVLPQDYIRTAWAKGLSERVIIIKHALKNSLIPVITLIGVGFRVMIGGSVLVETVFAIPGVGRLMVSSIFSQDYVVVQALTLVIAVLVLLINLVIDLFYGWLDPRIRYN